MRTLACLSVAMAALLAGCETSPPSPRERPLSTDAPVRVGLSTSAVPGALAGKPVPVPIVEAEPLVFSFAQIDANRAALAKSGVLSADGKRLIVAWTLGAPAIPAQRIDVRIVGQEPIAAGESWEAAVNRLNNRLKDRAACGRAPAPAGVTCRTEGDRSLCEIDATTRSVFKYDVRVLETVNRDPVQRSCLDPWGMIN